VLRQRREAALTVSSAPRSPQIVPAPLRVPQVSIERARQDQKGSRFVTSEQVVVGELVVPGLLGKRRGI